MTDYTNFFPSKEYTNPSSSNYDNHNSMNTSDALANAMNNKYTPNPMGEFGSEKAWSMRCGGQSGGGYTLSFNSNGLGGGNSSVMRYTKSCEPVIGDSMSGGGCGCGGVPVLKQNGGSTQIVNTLGKMLAPLGINELATIIVLLFLNHYSKEKTFLMKKQKGGNFNNYIGMLTPLGKDNLVVLASLLLLNYFAHKNKKTSKKQKGGGGDVLTFLDELLAPLGVNAFGTAWLLIILNEMFNKKDSKKQKGGSNIEDSNTFTISSSSTLQNGGNSLMKLASPTGLNSFASLVVLIALNQYLHKDKKSKKSQKGGELNNLINLINSYKKSNLNNIKMSPLESLTGGAKKKTMKKTTPKKKSMKKTMKKSTPKKTMKKSTPKKKSMKKTMKKSTPKKTMKKMTPKKKSMKKTTPKKKSMKKKSSKKSMKKSEGLLSFLGL